MQQPNLKKKRYSNEKKTARIDYWLQDKQPEITGCTLNNEERIEKKKPDEKL